MRSSCVLDAGDAGARLRRLGFGLGSGLFLSVLFAAPHAEADKTTDKKECAQAHAEAQKSMRATTLRKARDELKICARDACPSFVRKDCVGWLDEVNAGIPSIVVEAKGPDGKETFDVRLSINNEPIASKLDVKAIELDPGTFTLKFEREGSAPIEKEVVLRQGQKNKLVDVSFATTSSPAALQDPKRTDATTTTPKTAEKDKANPSGQKSVLPWVLGGVGVALAGGGAFFWLKSESERTDLQSTCAPRCAPSDADDIKTQRLVGDILAAAGVVAIGVAVVWLVTDFGSGPKANGNGVRWTRRTPTGFTF